MNAVFPFGFPAATAFYLSLYVLTLLIHVTPMSYVLAGSFWLAFDNLRRLISPQRAGSGVAEMLRDWLPFMLGAAITAGVAPLLFVQVLYKQSFYTANLLLLHRWMAILPVLIVAFYVLYLLKTRWVRRRRLLDAAAALVAALCFAFVAYSWTENHLLSLRADLWPAFYESRSPLYWDAHSLPRLAIWAFGAAPILSVIVAWQLVAYGRPVGGSATDTPPAESVARMLRVLARFALGGVALAGAGMLVYALTEPHVRSAATSLLGGPYLALAIVGMGLVAFEWRAVLSSGRLLPRELRLLTGGVIAAVLGMTVFREAIRLHSLDITPLYPLHAKAAQVGGSWLFYVFVLINALAIAWCVGIARGAAPLAGAQSEMSGAMSPSAFATATPAASTIGGPAGGQAAPSPSESFDAPVSPELPARDPDAQR